MLYVAQISSSWHLYFITLWNINNLIVSKDIQIFINYGHIELFYEFKLSNPATFYSVCENIVFTETQNMYVPQAAMHMHLSHTQRNGCL